MPVPNNAGQYVISGVAATAETWAFGFWVNDSTDIQGSDMDLNTDWVAFRNALLGLWADDQIMTKYTYRRYTGGSVSRVSENSVSHAGTNAQPLLPLQCSLVLTLRTSVRSRQGRGRIYLPIGTTQAMGASDHLYASTEVNNLVDKFAAFCTGSTSPVVVVSRTSGTMHSVTSVDADLVPDTQRRRRNQLSTARHSHAV